MTNDGLELLLGYDDSSGRFVYAGRAGFGITNEVYQELTRRLRDARSEACPFSKLTPARRRVRWVRPVLVAAVEQGAWKNAGLFREPVFRGLRDDLAAEQVNLIGS